MTPTEHKQYIHKVILESYKCLGEMKTAAVSSDQQIERVYGHGTSLIFLMRDGSVYEIGVHKLV